MPEGGSPRRAPAYPNVVEYIIFGGGFTKYEDGGLSQAS